ncbi:MAG: histidine phosphatase family protein [Planctomycetota bacterium]
MSKSPEVRVVLVRCGRTEWDAEERICGSADVPLCADGQKLAVEGARATSEGSIAVVLHGPDEASRETASAIAADLGSRTKGVDALAEMDLGLWEGLRQQDFEERYPTASRGWRDDPASVSAPEGETLGEADERVIGELARALERVKADGPIGVVLRPIAYGLATCWLRGMPMGSWRAAAEESGGSARYVVSRADLKGARDGTRSGAT